MTRDEWLRSDDPTAMLEWVLGRGRRPSDRKLRLFAVAVSRAVGPDPAAGGVHEEGERMADGGRPAGGERPVVFINWTVLNSDAEAAARNVSPADFGTAHGVISQAAKAAILRDILGDPFSPVTLPRSKAACRRCRGKGHVRKSEIYASRWDREECDFCGATGAVDGPCPWLTPEALSLADAAYTLRDSSGTLDNVRLSVLADALEEAGCPVARCKFCGGEGRPVELVRKPIPGSARLGLPRPSGDRIDCPLCNGSGVKSHPILSHLRSRQPHYRGMWSLDLLLGKA